MKKLLLPLALGAALSTGCDKHYHNNTYIIDPINNPNNPNNPNPTSFSFSNIPQQNVDEGTTLSFSIDEFASNPNVIIEVSSGPGTIGASGQTQHVYSYFNEQDVDMENNTYQVELTARSRTAGAFEPVRTTFTILQRDNFPGSNPGRSETLSSGLEAIVVDTAIGYVSAHQENQSSIALSSDNKPHLAYVNASGKPTIANKVGDNWLTHPFGDAEGGNFSFGFDNNNNKGHLIFDANTVGENLAYVGFDGSLSNRTIIDNAPSVGMANSMALDNNGKLHLSYFANGKVSYATNQTGSWEKESDLAFARWDQTSIAIDQNGSRKIGYVGSDGNIRLLSKQATGWQNNPIYAGTNPVLMKEGSNVMRFVFTGNNNGLYTATSTFGGPWVVQPIAGNHTATQKLDALVDSSNHVHIANISASALAYTTNQSGSWQTYIVDNNASHQNPDIALGNDGKLYLSSIRNGNEVQFTSFAPNYFHQ